MLKGDLAVKAVFLGLKSNGINVLETASELLPDLLVADPSYGLIGVDVMTTHAFTKLSEQDLKTIRSRKMRALREELSALDKGALIKYVPTVVPDITAAELEDSKRLVLRNISLPKLEQELNSTPELMALIEQAKSRFDPSFIFVAKPRVPSFERPEEVAERESSRILLDKSQATIAATRNSGVSIVTGPAGSGKTLVLVARARLLSLRNPSWRIRVVCFNNALKPYLESLVRDLRNVKVFTFYELITANGHSFRMKGATEEIAKRQYEGQLHISKNADALLVDEAQDFFAGWLKYLVRTVKDDRGGIFLAGDEKQSLYRQANLAKDAEEFSPQVLRLERPYRSTRQILEFVGSLLPEAPLDNPDLAPEGAVPDLVYVPAGSKKARFQTITLSLDIKRHLDNDPTLKLSDIGVLCTRHFDIKGIMGKPGHFSAFFGEIMGASKAIRPIFQGFAADLDMAEESIKVMTVHSAKGLEFRHVYLVGLEHLGDLEDQPSNNLGEAALNLIGPTRAKDRLTVYYSKDNVFLKRLALNEELYQPLRFPEDYEVKDEWLN
jgi:hypothetical protein